MSKQLLVLGCSQRKRAATGLLPAIDRYDGSSYRVLRNFLRSRRWPQSLSVAVLSARYGLMGGFTGIEEYDQRMTKERASALAPECGRLLERWSNGHDRVFFSLGKTYLPAVQSVFQRKPDFKTKVFEGPIGIKLQQIKNMLEATDSEERLKSPVPEPGSGTLSYFLPDWDDMLDEKFDFETDTFSGASPGLRGDKHCSVLMKPKRIHDGILVSLAQHVSPTGALRRITGTEDRSLAPTNLRERFGLLNNQSLFGDCGAFSYVNEDVPSLTVEQAVALYDLHGFDFGASVDHIPVSRIVRNGIISLGKYYITRQTGGSGGYKTRLENEHTITSEGTLIIYSPNGVKVSESTFRATLRTEDPGEGHYRYEASSVETSRKTMFGSWTRPSP